MSLLVICSTIPSAIPFVFFFFLGHLAKTLQEARVTLINQSVCNKLYDDLITSRMLCAGNLNGGIDACQVIWNLYKNYKGIFAFIGKLFRVVGCLCFFWFFFP